MSRRTLDGGRVLGSGRSLGPAVPQNIPKSPSPLPAHLVSPSASTLSLQSGSGTSTPPSSESQDLISRISIDHGDLNLAAAAASDRLSCPICNEEMVTLLQLNRHLDDAHKEIQEERQDEIEDWFKKQMVKAKKFQPLAVLNQKLKGIDIFESNDEGASTPVRRGSDPNTIVQRTASPAPVLPPRPKSPVIDPDDVVRKDHWQRHTNASIEKPEGSMPVDVRLCKECNTTLFSKRDFAESLNTPHPLSRSYQNLIQFERGIRMLMPQFQALLTKLQSPDHPPTSQDIANASKIRRRLIDAFTQYDIASRRVRDTPTDSPTQLKLQKAIYQQASQFLHLHMLPLKTLPKILKHASPHGDRIASPLANGTTNNTNGLHPPGAIHRTHRSFDSSSQISSTSSQISAMEAEEKQLRERLIVLEEQKFLVGEMLGTARKRRKFDEVASLQGNLEDLSSEIDGVVKVLGGLDFEGVYALGLGRALGLGKRLGEGGGNGNGKGRPDE